MYSYVSFLVWVDPLCILIFPFWSGWIHGVFLCFISALDGSLVYSYDRILILLSFCLLLCLLSFLIAFFTFRPNYIYGHSFTSLV